MKKSYLKYFVALLLFGSNGIIAGQIDMNSYEIVLFRTLIGGLMLLLLSFIRGNRFTFKGREKSFFFLLASGMAMGACWMFLYEAYRRVGVSVSSFLYYCAPVLVMISSPLLFREKLTREKLVGFFIVLVGIALVNGKASGDLDSFGLLCAGMSVVMYFLVVVLNKKATKITGLENAALQLTVAFFTVAAFVVFKQGLTVHVSGADLPWILCIGLLNTGFGCLLYFSAIAELPVQTVGAVLIFGGATYGECFGRKAGDE